MRALILALLLPVAALADYSVLHHDANGFPVEVTIMDGCWPGWRGAYADVPRARIYLCGLEWSKSHELAHIAGMRHTSWRVLPNGLTCATVTESGHRTSYYVGNVLCIAPFGRGEFIDPR